MFLGKLLTHPLPGETVEIKMRRHWWLFLKQFLWYSLLLFFPFILAIFSLAYYPFIWDKVFTSVFFGTLAKLVVSFYYLAVWLFFWNAWTDYYLDIWLVTNERILSFEQKGLFNRAVAELRMSRVQDVSVRVQGFMGTILNYGEVNIQTAGAEGKFIFKDVPQPYKVSEKIIQSANHWRDSHPIGSI
ncbi:PH domain-containing protein [Patescibacteria group bacterium]|nr:PH domain-containing protein [Patescibacteria group bacterium]